MQRRDRLKVVQERALVVPVVAKDENSRQPITVCSEQDLRRTKVTPKGFEKVINAKQEVLE